MGYFEELDDRTKAAKADPRTVHELISQILSASDDDQSRELMYVLHIRGTKDVLDAASDLCTSKCPHTRTRGAQILGELGIPVRSFPAESVQILLTMLATETNFETLDAICTALGHLGDPSSIPTLVLFQTHLSERVRQAVARSLSFFEHELATSTVIVLMQDEDAEVRRWATFGIGTLRSDLDTPTIRTALFARISDEDDLTRHNALMGLAHRKDKRIVVPLIQELESIQEPIWSWYLIRIAEQIADARLLPVLNHLRDTTTENHAELDKAIRRCAGETDELIGRTIVSRLWSVYSWITFKK